jgi:predicted nucleic acid-binding protein
MKFLKNLSTLVIILFATLSQSAPAPAPSTFEKDVSLSQSQKDALEEFKTLMENKVPHPYMMTDLYLLKWLRSKNFNILRAQEGLKNHLRWRAANQMDTINEEDWSDMEREFKYSLESRDKQGQPSKKNLF